MRQVFNSAQVAHVWAQMIQAHGRNAQHNFYFNNGTIFSYRDSWPLAVMSAFKDADGTRLVIVNDASYSVTTARHMRHVKDALRGLPVRLVSVPTSFGIYDSEKLETGNPEPLAGMALRCAESGVAEYEKALRKRCEYRAAWHLETARRCFSDAALLVSAIPDATQRRQARNALPKIPADFPATIRDHSGNVAPGLIATLADARRAMVAAESVAKMKKAVNNARGFWKAARDTGNSAEIRRIRCKSAISELKSAAIFAKRCALKLPRGLPSLKSVEKYRAALEPLEMVQRLDLNHSRVIHARNVAVENYYTAIRAMRNGTSLNVNALRRTLADTNNARSVGKVYGECLRVTDKSHSNAFQPDASEHKNASVRAAYVALHKTCAETIATLAPLVARVESMGNRAALENAQEDANHAMRADSNANVHALNRACTIVETAEKMRADNPELSRGLNVAYTPEMVTALEKQHAQAAHDARIDSLVSAATRAQTMARQCLDCDSRAAYTAVRDADAARIAMQNAQELLTLINHGARVADIPLSDKYQEASALFATLPALVGDAVKHAGSLEKDAVTAWRNRDAYAPAPNGTYFRIAANGEEIESSRGARVTIQAGSRLWKLIRATVESGESKSWPDGAGPAIGHFRARAIRADGSAIIGCHTISAQEARNFAEFMQWPPFDKAQAA